MSLLRLAAPLALATVLAGCMHIEVNEAPQAPPPAPVAISFEGFVAAPPTAGSPQEAADIAIARGPWSAERTAKAVEDDAFDPWKAFDDVLGPSFTAQNRPATKALFDQLLAVAGPPIGASKERWKRQRPFIANPAQRTCITPTDALRASASYPSGHAAMGWAWGLALAEVAPPDKADALIARGFQYGESRIVCGVHWASDVAAGRALGAAAIARMRSDPGSRALFEAARAELAR